MNAAKTPPRQLLGLAFITVTILWSPLAQIRGQEVPLVLKDSVEVENMRSQPFLGGAACDGEGNLYFRFFRNRAPASAPLLRLARDGRETVTFSLDQVPDETVRGGSFEDYAVDLRGRVYLLTHVRQPDSEAQTAIVRFSRDGHYDSTINIDASFIAWKLGVFPSGELLLSGLKEGQGKGEPAGVSAIGVFSSTGEVVKVFSPQEDVKLNYDGNRETSETEGLAAIGTSPIAPGEDGNIYLMRPGSKASIYVISPAGTVVRRLAITPPHDGFRAWDMRIGGGNIVVEFVQKHDDTTRSDRVIYSIFDSEGTRVIDYLSSTEVGGHLACYSPNGFTFLAPSPSGRLAIRRASLH